MHCVISSALFWPGLWSASCYRRAMTSDAIALTWPKALALAASLVGGAVGTATWVDKRITDHLEAHQQHPHDGAVSVDQYSDDKELLLYEIRQNRALLRELIRGPTSRHP